MTLPRPTPASFGPAAQLMACSLDHAARLAVAVHDRNRRQVAALLELAPAGRIDVLALALAELIDPEQLETALAHAQLRLARDQARPQLGAAPRAGRTPLPREHGTDRGYKQHRHLREDACPECRAAHAVVNRPRLCREEFARLTAAGVNAVRAAELSTWPAVLARHQQRLNAQAAS